MKFIAKNYNLISFLLIWSVYGFVTFLTKEYLFTDSLYFNSFSEQLSLERINDMINASTKFSFLSYFLIPIVLTIKFVLITLTIIMYGFMTSKKYRIKEMLSVIINAEIVFVFSGVIKFLYFLLIHQNYNLLDLQFFFPLSVINYFNYQDIESFLIYPLQTVNVFELLYWFALAYGISKVTKSDLQGGMKVVLSSYVPALLLWIVFVTFLSLNAG